MYSGVSNFFVFIYSISIRQSELKAFSLKLCANKRILKLLYPYSTMFRCNTIKFFLNMQFSFFANLYKADQLNESVQLQAKSCGEKVLQSLNR